MNIAKQLNSLGQGTYGPSTVGTSQDRMFVGSTPSNFLNSNPPGTVTNSPFGRDPLANFGFQFNVVPEPAPFLVLGAGPHRRDRSSPTLIVLAPPKGACIVGRPYLFQ